MLTCQVLEGVHNPAAGPSYSVARLADEILRRGHSSTILTLGPPPAEWPHRVPLQVYDDTVFRLTHVSPKFTAHIRRLSQEPYVLHGHGMWRFSNIFPLFMSRQSPARIIVSPRGMLSSWSMKYKRWRKLPFWVVAQRPALDRAHCFHATAPNEAEDLRRLGFKAPIAIIPNGIDLPRVPQRQRLPRVLFLSRIDPKKGLDLLFPIWAKLERQFRHWELHVAGPVEVGYEREFARLRAKFPLARCVFTGPLAGDAKSEAMATASVFVLPSYSENFGMVVAEALAYGLPVVTTTETPWSALTTQGCGWCVAPATVPLAAALEQALTMSCGKLADMGARGRAWMQRDFTWDAVAEQVCMVYQWLLHSGPAPACIDR